MSTTWRDRAPAWLPDAGAIALIVLIGLALFNPVFRTGATWSDVAGHQEVFWPWAAQPFAEFDDSAPQSDQPDTYHPWQVFTHASIERGEVPLWNPYSFGGQPFYTNGAGTVLYPPRLVASVVDPSWGHDLYMLAHLIAAGIAMFALLRSIGLRRGAALFGAVAWELNPWAVSWMQLETSGPVSVALPLGVLLMRRAVLHRSLGATLATALVLCLLAVGVNLAYVAYVWLAIVGYGLGLALRQGWSELSARRWRTGLAPAIPVVAAPVTALALGAAVLLPTWLAFGDAARTPVPAEVQRAAGTPTSWLLDAFQPRMPFDSLVINGQFFLGTAVAWLAVLGLVVRRPGRTLGVVLMTVVALAVTTSVGMTVAQHVVPGFRFVLPPGRVAYLWAFGGVLLAALGAHAVLERAARARRGHLLEPALAAALIGLTTWQLAVYARDVNPPFQPRRAPYLYPRTPAIAALERDRDSSPPDAPQRFLGIRLTSPAFTPVVLHASQPMIFELEQGGGYESVLPERTEAIWRVVGGDTPALIAASGSPSAFRPDFGSAATRYDLLDRVGVTTLYVGPETAADPAFAAAISSGSPTVAYAGPDGVVLRRGDQARRAFVVGCFDIAGSPMEALERYTDPTYPWQERVLLERQPEEPCAPVRAEVSVRQPDEERTEIDVNADAPGWLVVLDPGVEGWSADVDGDSTRLERANYAFRAVRIPAGDTTVVLRYRPPGLVAGIAISVLAVLACVGSLVVARLRRRPAPPVTDDA